MPRVNAGQTDQFSNEFNPAIGGVIDAILDYADIDDSDEEGFDLTLRSLELTTNAWIDPNAWVYAVVVADEEEIELEEAAVHYIGFEGNTTLRSGRFFIDFGKQMQGHVHDLAYPDRPAALRAYLGGELAGTGVQVDHWFATGDASAVRFSLGVFDSLLDAHDHGHDRDDEEEHGGEAHIPDRSELDELNLTARVTGFSDVGESGVFQWGLSLREVPEFTYELDSSGFELAGQSNSVLGADLTYGITGESGLTGWTFGVEALLFDGDIGAEVDDEGTPGDESDDTLEVFDDDAVGYYGWIDRAFDQRNSFGLLYSAFEHPEPSKPEDSELTLYYSRSLSEYARLRFAVTQVDRDEGGDSTTFLVQYTNFFGPHSHGVNW